MRKLHAKTAQSGSPVRSPDTRGNLPDTPCSAPCYSFRRRINQLAELFALCPRKSAENGARIADLPVFLPVSRERPKRRPVSGTASTTIQSGQTGPRDEDAGAEASRSPI